MLFGFDQWGNTIAYKSVDREGNSIADTNYTLTCPYSAKTTTGFTPSQTGGYIAKGRILLSSVPTS